jgi:hypothetical protein
MKYKAIGYAEYEYESKVIYVRPVGSTGNFVKDCNLRVYKMLYKYGKHAETSDLGTVWAYNSVQRLSDDKISSDMIEDINKEIMIEMLRH